VEERNPRQPEERKTGTAIFKAISITKLKVFLKSSGEKFHGIA